MLCREILGWVLVVETAFAVLAIFTDDWWEKFQLYNITMFVAIAVTLWIYFIKWLITGTLAW